MKINRLKSKVIICIITLLFTCIAYTADAQYGDAYHAPNNYLIEKNQRDYGEKMRNDIRSQRNSKTGVVGNNSSGAAELEAAWKANRAWRDKQYREPTASEIEAQRISEENYAKKRKEQEARMQVIYKEERLRTEKHKELCLPYITSLKKAGFTDNEANRIARRHIIDYTTLSEYPRAEYAKGLEKVLGTYNAESSKMDFAAISSTLDLLYYYAPFTTLKIIEETKKRFPDKEKELDNMTINSLEGYYGSGFSEDEISIADRYFTLLEKYPDISFTFLKNIYQLNKNADDPYKAYLRKSDNRTKSLELIERRINHISGITDFADKRKKVKAVKEMMATYNLSLAEIIFTGEPNFIKEEYEKIYTAQEKIFDMEKYREFNILFQDGPYTKLLYTLAEEGNEDAIKLYAVSLGNGYGTYTKQGVRKPAMYKDLLRWQKKGIFLLW